MALGKLLDGDLQFVPGMQSSLDPVQLPGGFFARGMNVVNRGGIVQCRPGYRCRMAIPTGFLQGIRVFKPKRGFPVLVFGVEGRLYTSDYPYKTFSQLPGIQFSETARQLYFEQVEQSVQFNPDGSISLIDPRNLLVIQDGGFSSAVVFDGTTATHQRGSGNIPIGGPMKWIADRLWVARGARLFASDLGNPLSFRESLYIAGVSSFVLPGDITALASNPASEFPQLFVFTYHNTTMIQAGVRDRSLWTTTSDFQKIVLPRIGCVSQRSVVIHYGLLWWFSAFGLISLDAAIQGNITSSLPYQDDSMIESKSRLFSDLSGVACSTFENYLLCSLPHEERYNKHTWVLDNTPLKVGRGENPAWNSFWTGTRPVEWISDTFNGENLIFYISTDYDGENRLWEAFTPDRLDEGCPITWWMETRAITSQSPGQYKDFRYADIFMSELLGVIDVAVFWAGSYRGKYKRVLTKRIRASRGTFRSGEKIKATDKIFALKKQSRHIRTQDGKAIIAEEGLSSCDVENRYEEFKDTAFQLLIVGSGPGAVNGFICYTEPPENNNDSGRCEEDETEENFVRFDGAASEANKFRDALSQFSGEILVFKSVRFETVTQGGLTEVGMGEGESVISQQDADKIASCIAKRFASNTLEKILPRIVSLGEKANEK